MDELFGLSMTVIMYVLLGVLGVALGSVGYVVLRSRIMFQMGLRNMPRRMGQSVLIVIGLMLSTLIISAAFTTGDTVDYSVTNSAFTLLGHTDEVIWVDGEDGPPNELQSTISPAAIEAIREGIERSGDSNIDGVMPVLFEPVPLVNPRAGQSEPNATFTGVDADSLEGFPDFISTTGREKPDVAALAPDEAYINESGADELAVVPGDVVEVYVQGQPHEFTVLDIVEDRFLAGVGDFDTKEGLLTRLDTLQQTFGEPGAVNLIAISNAGGVRDSVGLTDGVEETLEGILEDAGLFGGGEVTLEIATVKQSFVEDAEEAGNVFTTFFLAFGLFSIAAGMLLIVMIFVMLAAERQSEMGMARAVGTKRGHLVQMFMSEGMAYNVIAAAVGAGLGILVAFGIAQIMAAIFSSFGLSIEAHVTARSVVISYSLGVVLTYVTVVFSSWRVSNLNIVAAIRNIAESKVANPEHGTPRGLARGVLNAWMAVGALVVFLIGMLAVSDLAMLFLLGMAIVFVAPFIYMLRGQDFAAPADERNGRPIPKWPLIVVPLAPFYLLALAIVGLTRERHVGTFPYWLIVLGVAFVPLGLVLVALQGRDRQLGWGAGFGVLGIALGAIFMWIGMAEDVAFPFALGFSLVAFGLAVVLQFFGLPPRPVFTVSGVLLLLLWGLTAGARLEFLFGTLNGDIEMFFLSGVAMVAASTFVLIYNADLVLQALERLGSLFSSVLPAMRTAVAYPLAAKFRTGMTLAMISLVVFALTMMSTMNLNFNKLFLTDEARGGWDVIVDENPNNPVLDLESSLRSGGSSVADEFRATGRVGLRTRSEVAEVFPSRPAGLSFDEYPVLSVDTGFLEGSSIPLAAIADGYGSEEEVWRALREEPDVAIVDGFTVEGGGAFAEDTFGISGIDSGASTFEPIELVLRDAITDARRTVTVIGVIDFGASSTFFGVYVGQETFSSVFSRPDLARHYVGLNDPGDSKRVAQEIEATLLTAGVQAESLKERIDDEQALSRNFFLLMQGFMGLGLFVGIAAVGVIAFRTVVERRQQIGMLRAIGYKRSTVALSFVLESSFITVLAIASGVGLAIWLSYFLITSDEFPSDLTTYYVPWLQIAVISAFTWLASLAMTIIPSRQAASIPTAEALRYE